MGDISKYAALIPMAYLIIIAAVNVAFHMLGVPKEIGALITGAALTRVKISTPPK